MGLPLSIVVTKSICKRPNFLVLTCSAVFGFGITLVASANCLALGFSWKTTSLVTLSVWVVSVLFFALQLYLNQTDVSFTLISWGLCRFGFLNLLVGSSAILLSISKPGDAILNLRLGVDFALYSDAAQLLIEMPSLGLSQLYENSPTTFGIAAFANHLRWGAPIILALSTWFTRQAHSIQAIIPIAAISIGLVSNITIVLARKLGLGRIISILSGLLIIVNFQIISFALEGHFPQLIFMPFFLSILFLWSEICRQPGIARLVTVSGIAILISGSVLVYSEYILILLALLSIITILETIGKKWSTVRNTFISFLFTVALSAAFVPAYTLRLIKHILGLSVQVGYPIPHFLLPAEFIGVGTVWTRWADWMTPSALPVGLSRQHRFSDVVVSLVVIFLAAIGVWSIRHRSSGFRMLAASGVIALVILRQFVVTTPNSYLWVKGIVPFSPLILLTVLLGISSIAIWQGIFSKVLMSLLTVSICFTAFSGIASFRASARPLFEDSLTVRGYLNSQPTCAVLLQPRGWTPIEVYREASWNGSITRIRDYVYDHNLVPIFRSNPVLDSWGVAPLAWRQTDVVQRLQVCLVFSKAFSSSSSRMHPLNSDTYREVLRTKHWVVVETTIEVYELGEMGIDALYLDFLQPASP